MPDTLPGKSITQQCEESCVRDPNGCDGFAWEPPRDWPKPDTDPAEKPPRINCYLKKRVFNAVQKNATKPAMAHSEFGSGGNVHLHVCVDMILEPKSS